MKKGKDRGQAPTWGTFSNVNGTPDGKFTIVFSANVAPTTACGAYTNTVTKVINITANELNTLELKWKTTATTFDKGIYSYPGWQIFSTASIAQKNQYANFLKVRDRAQAGLETYYIHEKKLTPEKAKIAARFHLVEWLKKQGAEGERIVQTWKLDRADGGNAERSFNLSVSNTNVSVDL